MGWFADFFSNPTLSQGNMTRKDNGKRKGDWLQPATEAISDWIPNEFSKTSNNWTGNIPYVGWALRGLAGADNFSESYSNSGDMFGSAMHGAKGFMGNASDPDMNSPKNKAGLFGSGDPWLSVGQGVNLAPSYGGSYGVGGQGASLGNMTGGTNNIFGGGSSKNGGGMGSILGMMGNGQGQQGSGMDISKIMNMFGGQQQKQQNPRNAQRAQFNAMMMSYIQQMMQNRDIQNQYQQPQQQQEQTQQSYNPRIEFGNLYRPEVSGIGAY
jgi:hypothetical protein